MTMTDKLDLLMLQRGITRKELADATNIPYSTISSFYDKGTENVKLSNLLKLARYFECSLDYIADDNITEKGSLPIESSEPSVKTIEIFNNKVNDLSKKDKDKLFKIIEIFLEE